jgi:hypothetical protein
MKALSQIVSVSGVILLALALGCDSPAEREQKNRMSQIKYGMSESEVVKLLGLPKKIETAPFAPASLPVQGPECDCNKKELSELAASVRRAHYEWKIPVSKDQKNLLYLEIYYDNKDSVRYTQDWSGIEFSMISY